jgi:hypothetical protein
MRIKEMLHRIRLTPPCADEYTILAVNPFHTTSTCQNTVYVPLPLGCASVRE